MSMAMSREAMTVAVTYGRVSMAAAVWPYGVTMTVTMAMAMAITAMTAAVHDSMAVRQRQCQWRQ